MNNDITTTEVRTSKKSNREVIEEERGGERTRAAIASAMPTLRRASHTSSSECRSSMSRLSRTDAYQTNGACGTMLNVANEQESVSILVCEILSATRPYLMELRRSCKLMSETSTPSISIEPPTSDGSSARKSARVVVLLPEPVEEGREMVISRGGQETRHGRRQSLPVRPQMPIF